MAVTGVFAADFSKFDSAVQESAARLKGLETAGTQVESSLRLMTKSQEQMLDQIGASGGRIEELGATAGETSGQVNTLSESYHQFDGLLQAAGVNIGPQIKGLEDISAAAGKTATEIGLLGTAGLAAGAFMTGWKIGEFIDGLTGASKAVEDLTTKLLGYQSLAGETAGAKQDVINRAIAQGAKDTISYTDAIKFNTEQVQKHADAQINWTQTLADAYREVRNVNDATKEEIAIAQEAGATTEQLTNKYGLSATALGILADKHREAGRAAEEQRAAQEKLNHEYDALMSNVKNANQLAIMEADAAKLKADHDAQRLKTATDLKNAIVESARASNEAAKWEAAHATEQEKVEAENQQLIASYTKAGAAAATGAELATTGAQATAGAYAGVTQQVNISADAIRGWLAVMQFTNQSNAILSRNSLFTTQSQRDELARLPIPSFAGGVDNFAGGLAKVHDGELLVNLPGGTSVIPKGQGGAVNIANTFNLVDSESNLARRVSELIMRNIRAGTQMGTV